MTTRPTLVFDGDCGFCRYWVARWTARLGDRVEAVAFQDSSGRFPAVPREAFEKAVHLIEPDGSVTRGAEAVFRCLGYGRGFGWLLALYRRLPGFRPASEALYGFIVAHRPFFLRLTVLVFGRPPVGPGEGVRPRRGRGGE